MVQSLVARRLYGSREEEASFAYYSRLNALTLCLVEHLGVQHTGSVRSRR